METSFPPISGTSFAKRQRTQPRAKRRGFVQRLAPVVFVLVSALFYLAQSEATIAQDTWAGIETGLSLLAEEDPQGAAEEFNKAKSLGHAEIAAILSHLSQSYHALYSGGFSREASPESVWAKTIASEQARSHLQEVEKIARKARLPHSDYIMVMKLAATVSQASADQRMAPLLRAIQCHLQLLSGVAIPRDEARPTHLDAGEQTRISIPEPKRIFDPQASYTRLARTARIQGHVVLGLTITADGCATDLRVLKALPYDLEKSALEGARWWVFEPETLDGLAVFASSEITMWFMLPRAK